MAKEYIEREALLKHKMPVYGAYDSSLTFEAVPVPYIKGTPTADVQEVVRCKDCKHNSKYLACNGNWYNKCNCDSKLIELGLPDNFYCSYGTKIDKE